MAKRLFVGGLPWATTDADLSSYFSKVGTVASASVITDRATGRSKGFGFVEMSSDEEAEKAIKELNGSTMGDRTIVVNEARPMEKREDRGGYGGDRGRRQGRDEGRGGNR